MCVLKDGFTTKYFNLKKGACQGGPISAYLFILSLEIISFTYQKRFFDKKILKFLTVVLYTTHANDSTFFLKDLAPVKNLLDIIFGYSKYSGLKPNFSKSKIAEIGSLKAVKVAVCGIKCVNLKVNTIEILGIHFSYNNKFNMEKHFLTPISNIQNVLKKRGMRNLPLEGKKVIACKMLALSKIVYLCLTPVVPKQITEEIEDI